MQPKHCCKRFTLFRFAATTIVATAASAATLCACLSGCVPSTTVSLSERKATLAELEKSYEATKAGAGSGLDGIKPSNSADLPRVSDGNQRTLLDRIDAVLIHQLENRTMDSSVNAAWQIMHGVVCYGQQQSILTPDRGRVSALDYAFHGGSINGFELYLGDTPLPSTGRTGIRARVEPGSYIGQGHPDQWLAICAMSNVPSLTEVEVGGERRTLMDWSHQVQWDIKQNLLEEFSWTLIALTHYLPDEPRWTPADGTQVDWEALVDVELTYDLDSSPCGGTHRLSGLVRAVAAKKRLNLPNSDVWERAEQTVQQCITNAKDNRSSDGSLSSYYFVRPAKSVDLAAELASAGHLFEFLALAVEDSELRQPWMQLAGDRVCTAIERTQEIDMECGALYHALNGLKLYRDRCRISLP